MPVASRKYQERGHVYCAEQINIPVTLPNILKSYAKAAVRTQPYDLLRWTAAYFRALAQGEIPPMKTRLEYPPYSHPSGVTPRFLRALLNQYWCDKDGETRLERRSSAWMHVTLESLLRRWRGMALSDESLYRILMTGRLLEQPPAPEHCDLYRFLAIACGLLGNNLLETMIYVCELLTDEPDGGSAMIPLKTFTRLYEYLAELDCSGSPRSIIETGPRDDSASGLSASDFSPAVSSTKMEIGGRREESLCHWEVACLADNDGEDHDEEEERRGGSCRGCEASVGSSSRRGAPKPRTERRNSRDDKNRQLEREVGDGEVGESSPEVTKVQEERRRDVELHSSRRRRGRTVDARLLVDGAHHHSALGFSSHHVHHEESHVGPRERDTTGNRRPTDKILARRSRELSAQVEGVEESKPGGREGDESSITALRNANANRNRPEGRNRDGSDGPDADKVEKKEEHRVETSHDTFERGDRNEVSGYEEEEEKIEEGEEDDSDEEEFSMESMTEGFSDVFSGVEYEPMGLEKMLGGTCGCLEEKEGTRPKVVEAVDARQPPLDPVREFLEARRVRSPEGEGALGEKVPGIGAPVSPHRVTQVGLWLNDCARRQQGYVAPRNLRHFLCPALEEDSGEEDCCGPATRKIYPAFQEDSQMETKQISPAVEEICQTQVDKDCPHPEESCGTDIQIICPAFEEDRGSEITDVCTC